MSSSFLMPSITLSLRLCLNCFSLSHRARLKRRSRLVLHKKNENWATWFLFKAVSRPRICVCKTDDDITSCGVFPLKQMQELTHILYHFSKLVNQKLLLVASFYLDFCLWVKGDSYTYIPEHPEAAGKCSKMAHVIYLILFMYYVNYLEKKKEKQIPVLTSDTYQISSDISKYTLVAC